MFVKKFGILNAEFVMKLTPGYVLIIVKMKGYINFIREFLNPAYIVEL